MVNLGSIVIIFDIRQNLGVIIVIDLFIVSGFHITYIIVSNMQSGDFQT